MIVDIFLEMNGGPCGDPLKVDEYFVETYVQTGKGLQTVGIGPL